MQTPCSSAVTPGWPRRAHRSQDTSELSGLLLRGQAKGLPLTQIWDWLLRAGSWTVQRSTCPASDRGDEREKLSALLSTTALPSHPLEPAQDSTGNRLALQVHPHSYTPASLGSCENWKLSICPSSLWLHCAGFSHSNSCYCVGFDLGSIWESPGTDSRCWPVVPRNNELHLNGARIDFPASCQPLLIHFTALQ